MDHSYLVCFIYVEDLSIVNDTQCDLAITFTQILRHSTKICPGNNIKNWLIHCKFYLNYQYKLLTVLIYFKCMQLENDNIYNKNLWLIVVIELQNVVVWCQSKPKNCAIILFFIIIKLYCASYSKFWAIKFCLQLSV